MYKRDNWDEFIIWAIIFIVGIILVTLTHKLKLDGSIFLPIYIPIILAGYLLPKSFVLSMAILLPLSSYFMSGMPNLYPTMLIIIVELSALGICISDFYRKSEMTIAMSLITSIICSKLILALFLFILAAFFSVELDPMLYIINGVKKGFPGIIIQLIIIPGLVYGIVTNTNINLE